MSRLFTPKLIMQHWSLLPIVGITGFACVMCGSYITYMCKTKPDLTFRFGDNSKLPEMKVEPDHIRKLYVTRNNVEFDKEIEALRQELSSVH